MRVKEPTVTLPTPAEHRSGRVVHPLIRINAAGDRGLTLVEMLIALVIVSILFAVTVPMWRGARKTAHKKAVMAAAFKYAQAVDEYRNDHDGLAPGVNDDGVTWPHWTDPKAGPMDGATRYLRGGTPEIVQASVDTGGADFVLARPNTWPQPGPEGYTIVYRPSADGMGYRITVYSEKFRLRKSEANNYVGGNGKEGDSFICWIGTDPPHVNTSWPTPRQDLQRHRIGRKCG